MNIMLMKYDPELFAMGAYVEIAIIDIEEIKQHINNFDKFAYFRLDVHNNIIGDIIEIHNDEFF